MKVFASSIVFAGLTASVSAHGYISKPAATYEKNPNIEYNTGYNAVVTASVNSGFDGGTYNWSPEDNVKSFTEHWAATGYKSLKEMCDPIATDYGWSVTTATPIDVSDYTEFWWQNDQYQEGFIASHRGPCELWIDDTRVWHYDDCAGDFTSFPAKVPTDYSSCNGDCLVVFYWLALHEPNWQIYKQCVPITNNGSGTPASGGDSSSTNSTTPAATTAAPTATTAAPTATTSAPSASSGYDDEYPATTTAAPSASSGYDDEYPAASGDDEYPTDDYSSSVGGEEDSTPAATTSAPAPAATTAPATGDKCTVRRRKN